MLPDCAGRYLREPERTVAEAMLAAQELLLAPEPYFDPALTHRRRTYVGLVRLLARPGTVRFTLEPKERLVSLRSAWTTARNRGSSSSMLGGAICGCAPVRTWRFSRVKASQSWKSTVMRCQKLGLASQISRIVSTTCEFLIGFGLLQPPARGGVGSRDRRQHPDTERTPCVSWS